MIIPDFMPNIKEGTGDTPADGGCLVQIAGWLNDGHSWTDRTPCVHPVLRDVAIELNDSIEDDNERRQIMRFAPRLIGTGVPGDYDREMEIGLHIRTWAVSQAIEAVEQLKAPGLDCDLVNPTYYLNRSVSGGGYSMNQTVKSVSFAADAVAVAAAALAADDGPGVPMGTNEQAAKTAARIKFLDDLIDEYDRFTGREVSGATVSDEQWKSLAREMGATVS